MELYKQYIKEREGVECIYDDASFATYKIAGDECYVKDIYVRPQHRLGGLATKLTDEIAVRAKAKGCKFLTGTVQVGTPGDSESLLAQLKYGFRLNSIAGNMIVLEKEI